MLSCSMAKSCSLVSGVGWYHFVFCFRIRFVGCLFFEKVKLQNGITNKKGTNSHLISQFWCGNQVFVPVGKSRHALEQPPTETRKAEPWLTMDSNTNDCDVVCTRNISSSSNACAFYYNVYYERKNERVGSFVVATRDFRQKVGQECNNDLPIIIIQEKRERKSPSYTSIHHQIRATSTAATAATTRSLSTTERERFCFLLPDSTVSTIVPTVGTCRFFQHHGACSFLSVNIILVDVE